MAADVLIPIVLSVLVALVLRPIVGRLQRMRIPTVVGSLLVVAVVALLVVVGIVTLAGQAQNWLASAPSTVEKVRAMLPTRAGPINDLQKASEAVRELTKLDDDKTTTPVEVKTTNTAATILGASGKLFGNLFIVLVLTFFLLAFGDSLLNQAVNSRPTWSEKRNVVHLVQNVQNGISKYLATITVINIGLGAVTALALWLLKLPNPILWGVMAGMLNYVPHVGAFACLVILFFVGAVAHENLLYGLGVAATFWALTTIESYFITPLLLSRSLQLSPLAVIVALMIFGWMWGIAGGLMAAPIVAVVKIVCDQFDSLRPIGVILGGESPSRPAAAHS